VNEFIVELEPDVGLAFYLTDVEGLTAAEVAEDMKVNLNTLNSRLRTARKQLAVRLARYERWGK
jgi:DNA-directed RNA polymerase specialized sigma24 family protein